LRFPRLKETKKSGTFCVHGELLDHFVVTKAKRLSFPGARCVVAAMELWLWTLRYLLEAKDAQSAGISFPMAEALSWLLASRYQSFDVLDLEKKGQDNAALVEVLPGFVSFLSDLCHVQAARAPVSWDALGRAGLRLQRQARSRAFPPLARQSDYRRATTSSTGRWE